LNKYLSCNNTKKLHSAAVFLSNSFFVFFFFCSYLLVFVRCLFIHSFVWSGFVIFLSPHAFVSFPLYILFNFCLLALVCLFACSFIVLLAIFCLLLSFFLSFFLSFSVFSVTLCSIRSIVLLYQMLYHAVILLLIKCLALCVLCCCYHESHKHLRACVCVSVCFITDQSEVV